MNRGVALAIAVIGIWSCFVYYGSLMEDVLTFKSPHGKVFKYAWFLQVMEACSNLIFGFVCNLLFEGGPRKVPLNPYVISGAVQVSAKYCFTASMVWGVSFPVATLAKSSKMIPVMIGSLLLGKAKYSLADFGRVAIIVAGTAVVSIADKAKKGQSSSLVGLFFLIGSLTCDGIVGGTQKRLKVALADLQLKEKNFEMQFMTNLFMMLTAIVFALLMGEMGPGCAFLVEYPAIFSKILQFVICSALGQGFIFFAISTFDPLVCSTITTTRKVFSVLFSIFTKGHRLNTEGWCGLALACGGILGELAAKSVGKKTEGGSTKVDSSSTAPLIGNSKDGDVEEKR
jgi:UDP-galactose transporter B1